MSLHPLFADIMDAFRKPIPYAYCDYIAHRISTALATPDPENILAVIGRVHSDLHPEGRYLVTTKKTLFVTDRAGKRYRVTVEECE